MTSNFKILIVGFGSIGKRHYKNLQALGVENIAVVEVDPKRKEQSQKEFSCKCFSNLEEALKELWDCVFICVPPVFHTAIALKVARKTGYLFIEKPIASSLRGLNKLAEAKVKIMVGYNLLFHPQFAVVKDNLKKLDRIYSARSEFGQYLPDWHPYEDYAKGYSANKKLGGGIVLDDTHEIDLLYNLFGMPSKVIGVCSKLSNLKINSEDTAEIILKFKNGVLGQIHMDYLQRDYARNLKIIAEKGTLLWDIKEKLVKMFSSKSKKWQTISCLPQFDFNETYLNEIKHLLNCLKINSQPKPGLKEGIDTLKIALLAKKQI